MVLAKCPEPANVSNVELAKDKRVQAARKHVRQTDQQTVADMLAAVAIPAPPFGEDARAEWVAEQFRGLGLRVHTDEVGNVITYASESIGDAPVIVSAHLDTIFPRETKIDVRRNGHRIFAPGIADNSRGVAALLAVARALQAENITTERSIVYVATVGEEGVGDLRGVKHLFRAGSELRKAAAFISLDGTGRRRIVYRAIGSRRLRVTISGPGGHSWADWGIANPVHALGVAISSIAQTDVPRQPRTAVTVARIFGGTSVNAIPADAWLELDIRSEAANVIADMEALVRAAVKDAVSGINGARKRGTPALEVDLRVIGDRPSGETSVNSALVRAARAATRYLGDTPELVASSTDANIPIALGIPAIAIGAGGESGGTHTLEEWYMNTGGADGIERALLIVLAVAGVR
jgi:acetylornithine deacetylase/succinyl-diaminopimelate desuccinylase-like protein